MLHARRTHRITGGFAATAVGLSVVAHPATAAADTEYTIDLGALNAAEEKYAAAEASGTLSDAEMFRQINDVAGAVTIEKVNSTTDSSDDTSAPSTSPATSTPATKSTTHTTQTATPTTTEPTETAVPTTDLDHENDALAVANRVPANIGKTATGQKVVFPVEGHFTSGFGPRNNSFHEGIDIGAPLGTPIRAVMDGTVVATGPASGYGNWVVLQHPNGAKSIYGHMKHWDVSVGQQVTAGEKIAEVGNEGRSTGPHLHFEIHPDGGAASDPVTWFANQGINVTNAMQVAYQD